MQNFSRLSAWISLLVATGCSGASDPADVGALPEEEVKAAPPAASESSLVTVRLLTLPAGRTSHVLYYDGQGNLLGTQALTAQSARLPVPAGGAVTVVGKTETPYNGKTATRYSVRSTLGVQPGDVLLFDESKPAQRTVDIQAPLFGANPIAHVNWGCGHERYSWPWSGNPFDPLGMVTFGCGATMDVFAYAYDASGNEVAWGLYKPAVPVGDTVKVTGTYTPTTKRRYTLANFPANKGEPWLEQWRGNIMRNTYPAGQSPASFELPTFAALPTDGTIHFRWGIGGNADLHVFDKDDFTKPSYAANFAEFAMPYASEVAYSAATSTFSWKAVGAGTPTQVMVELEGDYDEFVARTLAVFGPYPANGRLQVPELPPEFAAYAMPDKDRAKVYLGAHAQGLAATRPVAHKNMLDALSAGRYVYTVDSGN